MADQVENLTEQIDQVSMEDTVRPNSINMDDFMDFPHSIIVTNIDDAVFDNEPDRVSQCVTH